jgi:hypothetical protein
MYFRGSNVPNKVNWAGLVAGTTERENFCKQLQTKTLKKVPVTLAWIWSSITIAITYINCEGGNWIQLA